jgi:nitric oxide dioxygenase
MLSENTLSIIESTAPVLKEHGLGLIEHFYQRMLTHQPELKHLFNQTHQKTGQQAKALAGAVLAYAQHIRNLDVLLPAVNRMAHKHASVNVRPEHYPIVGKHLLASIQEVLNLPADHTIIQAWAEAYQQLASILISVEAKLYEQASTQSGGWSGFRPFRIEKKEIESHDIVSLYLYPTDLGSVPLFQAGQYVSVKSQVEGITQLRQYSLSDAPNRGYLRLSVKNESAQHILTKNHVSGWIHQALKEGDIIEMTPPFGHFTLQEKEKNTPIVFMSGGVGQTPLMSMLNDLILTKSQRQISWIHAAKSSQHHAFGKYIHHLTSQYPNIQAHFFYEQPSENNTIPHTVGRINQEQIKNICQEQARYYLCGPIAFMLEQYQHLTRLGVPQTQIHYEVFGSDHLGL